MLKATTYRATDADIPLIMEMGQRFIAAAWEIEPDAADTEAYVRSIIADGAIFLHGQAMLGAIVSPIPFNTRVLVATELFWWSEAPGAGRRVFEAFETWAIYEAEARFLNCSTVHEMNPAAARFYERRGYRLREQTWVREV